MSTSLVVRTALATSLGLLAACDGSAKRPCGVCTAYGPAVVVGNVNSPAVNELSGIAASHRYSDVYYVEDDDPVSFEGLSVSLHAIDGTGKVLGNWQLKDARVGNLEEIKVGPCPAGSCIYTGDVGNNSGDQSPYPMYRFPEPTIDRTMPAKTELISDYDTIWLEYPDGAPRDCEAFVVQPDTADIYLIQKKTGSKAAVFHVPPWPVDAIGANAPTLTMTAVGDLSLVPDGTTPEDQLAVGADIHPCASKMLVHTYSHAYEFTLPDGGRFEDIFHTTPIKVTNPSGSEAIGYLDDGLGYLSVPEGANPALTVVRCEEELDAGVSP